MDEVILKGSTIEGLPLEAHFALSRGMNLLSYKKGDREVIDQSTKPLFEERYAGLGAMIGPHFHHRNPATISPVPHEERFPHIALLKQRGVQEPFSHGIGRYAPWKIESQSPSEVKATLTGSQEWNGVPLKQLEGQDFVMHYAAKMLPEGLSIHLAVKSDTESVVGLHTYYALDQGKGVISARVQNHYRDAHGDHEIPSTWNFEPNQTLIYPLEQETDCGFYPFPDALNGLILLECPDHSLRVQYSCPNSENSFQLWHPLGASFVCIEPLSAQNPRKPKLTVSSLKILISIL